jgi:hypothetical protein
MMGHRHAAATLHGLHEEDRDYLLGALPADDRAVIVRYLAELNELGFAPDDMAGSAFAPKPPIGQVPDARRDVHAASPREMFNILEHEPAALVAHLLRSADWPWTQEFLQLLEPDRRQRVQTLAARGTNAPLRDAFLLSALADKLREQQKASADSPMRSDRVLRFGQAIRLSTLYRRVTAWMR